MPRGETVRERAKRIRQLSLQQSNSDTDQRKGLGLYQEIQQSDYDGNEEKEGQGEGIGEEILFPRFSYRMPVAVIKSYFLILSYYNLMRSSVML